MINQVWAAEAETRAADSTELVKYIPASLQKNSTLVLLQMAMHHSLGKAIKKLKDMSWIRKES